MTEVREFERGKKPVTIAALPRERRKLRVAAYCRVSTVMESQATSMRSQDAHYRQMIAAEEDWVFAGIYPEAGVSGTGKKRRPQLQKLAEDCRAGRIDLILTKSISRLARNTADCIEMVRALTDLGVHVYFEKENIHTGRMESEFMLSILACLAQEESRSISDNCKWGIRRRFENGTFRQGTPPYGYAWQGDQLVIVPGKAAVVRRIFRSVLDGQGLGRIAEELNREGIPSPRGRQWSRATLRQMVENPAYKGDMLCQKTYMDDSFTQRKNNGELDQFLHRDHHVPIIAAEEFEKARRAALQKTGGSGSVKERRCL